MDSPTPDQILAASSPWLGALLNLVPGVGTGYIYQRRWRAYWITTFLAVLWVVVGILLDQDTDPVLMPDMVQRNQAIGLIGFAVLGLVTAIEAYQAARNPR